MGPAAHRIATVERGQRDFWTSTGSIFDNMLSDKSYQYLTRTIRNQKGLITKARNLGSTKFFFSFVFSLFRVFVIKGFFHKMQRIHNYDSNLINYPKGRKYR